MQHVPATASGRRRLDYVNQWGQGAAAPCPNAHGNDLTAPVPPGEPPQPPSSAEPSGAAVQSIEPPRPLSDKPTDGQSSKETSAEQSRAISYMNVAKRTRQRVCHEWFKVAMVPAQFG